jgi:hypothetical protein
MLHLEVTYPLQPRGPKFESGSLQHLGQVARSISVMHGRGLGSLTVHVLIIGRFLFGGRKRSSDSIDFAYGLDLILYMFASMLSSTAIHILVYTLFWKHLLYLSVHFRVAS